MTDPFTHFARWTERQAGRSHSFAVATLLIITWAATGPLFSWSDTWQLVINTGTTIVTFLMVFLIQHSQNRDTQAIQLKLDELIRASKTASNDLINLEELSEGELAAVKEAFVRLAERRGVTIPELCADIRPRDDSAAGGRRAPKRQSETAGT